MNGRSGFEALHEYTKEPITRHHFAKTTSDVPTSATVRLTADGSTPCNVYVHVESLAQRHRADVQLVWIRRRCELHRG